MTISNSNIIRIPVVGADAVSMRFSSLPRTGDFDPSTWRCEALSQVSDIPGEWWEVNLAHLAIQDGSYEYDFEILRSGEDPIYAADPYAEELTRFGGYRGIFHIRGGHRYRLPFSWEGEILSTVTLPNNNEIVIYELPMRWVDSSPDAYDRQVGLGTFDKAIFERLPYLQALGINAIELLPAQDSPDTLNWGYGTRFFFAPDLDMGAPVDLKLFIKECHRRGIRVILDVVMNHSRSCPLEALAYEMFYLKNGEEEKDNNGQPRNGWGGRLFRYREKKFEEYFARSFHYDMAEFWIKEYHIDGFRIDEFKGIDNWDFIHNFRIHAWQIHQTIFPQRPFIVIAEDSARRPYITSDLQHGKIVDALWDFDYRDELRRIAANGMVTFLGQPSRSERARAMITGSKVWDDMGKHWRQRPVFGSNSSADDRFVDLAQRITYNTSHDVEGKHEHRLLPYFLNELGQGLSHGHYDDANESLDLSAPSEVNEKTVWALAQVHTTFALMFTTVGIPMFLAGEEFAEIHDTDPTKWRLKMSDPVDWQRASSPRHKQMLARVTELVHLRTTHPALHRNEVEFFGLSSSNPGFHPDFDGNSGVRVFAYCRTNGQPLGTRRQVIVVANCGRDDFIHFRIDWPWRNIPLSESGGVGQTTPIVAGNQATMALSPFQVRIFWS